jgi:hypothetical protein
VRRVRHVQNLDTHLATAWSEENSGERSFGFLGDDSGDHHLTDRFFCIQGRHRLLPVSLKTL